jgi:hypothetical protein
MVEVHILTVVDYWNDKASGCGDSCADVNKISVNHFSIINDGIDHWLFFKSLH